MTRFPATSPPTAVSTARDSLQRVSRSAVHFGPGHELRDFPSTDQAIRAVGQVRPRRHAHP